MELRHLATFLSVAHHLSFIRAAELLNYAQSSVSAQIQTLEDELGVKLFDRLGRRIVLTEAGEHLLPYAEKLVTLAAETRSEMLGTRQPGGTLTIRIPESFGVCHLPAILKTYCTAFPAVRLQFITCAVEGLQRDLRKGVTDLAFLFTESISESALSADILGTETIIIVAAPDHPLVRKQKITIKDFADHPLLLSRVDCAYRRSFESMLAQNAVKPTTVMEFNSVAAIRRCVAEGLGITILPLSEAAEDLTARRLAVIPYPSEAIEVAILMVWYKEKWLSPALKAFMEVVRAYFEERHGKA
ncbi:MAG: LysR family transcriptional regulator [Pseudomonadota bacterium]